MQLSLFFKDAFADVSLIGHNCNIVMIAAFSLMLLTILPSLSVNTQPILRAAFAEAVLIYPNSTNFSNINTNANVSHTFTLAEPLNATAKPLSYTDLFAKVKNSVVEVTSTISPYARTLLPPGYNRSQPEALGSGFIIDKEGHVVTNHHVVAGAENVTVTFADGTIYKANVIGSDTYSDVAVLSIDGNVSKDRLVPLPLANSSALAVGEQVAAIGNPYGLSSSFTTGVISGIGRVLPEQLPPGGNSSKISQLFSSPVSIPNVIQTDALINPGNSGGPLLDLKGEVVGMNTATLLNPSPLSFSGIGLAIPSDTIRQVLPSLIVNGTYIHPWVGITGTDVTPEIASKLGLKEAKGVLIIDIVMDSPAYKARLRGGDIPVTDIPGYNQSQPLRLGGDIIVKIDSQPIQKFDDMLSYLETHKRPGQPVTFTILRDGKITSIDLVLGAKPPLP